MLEKILDKWNTAIIIHIYKKGNTMENYREIFLLEVGY